MSQGKRVHFSTNDALYDGRFGNCSVYDPFDLFCHFQHGGEIKPAVKEAAELLGIEHKAPPAKDVGKAVELTDSEKVDRADRPIILSMDQVEPKTIDWLWQDRVPLGRVSLWAGVGGVGKGFTCADLMARVTTGSPGPDGSMIMQGDVLAMLAEDNPHDVFRPRLDAHHADVSRVKFLKGIERTNDEGKKSEVFFTLACVGILEQAIQQFPDLKLVVIDPIGSFIGGQTDSNTDNAVREVLAPVAMLAEKYNVPVLCIAHHRKTTSMSADELVLGSRAFTAFARAVWHFFPDPHNNDRRLMLPGKTNIARRALGLAYEINGEPAHVSWERQMINQTADQFMAERARPGPEPEAQNEAAEWLRDALAAGPVEKNKLEKEAKDAGISWSSIRRAQDRAGIKIEKCSFTKKYQWRLKHPGIEPAQVEQPTSS